MEKQARKVKIYGAGSIGNHLAQASRRIGWEVFVADPNPEALRRMKEEIYPSRYGRWDDSINLYKLGTEPRGCFDVIFLGTPPDVRMKLALSVLSEEPKVLQFEKPLCPPSLEGVEEFVDKLKNCSTKAVIGYDYVLSQAIKRASEIIKSPESKLFGEPLALDVEFREHWGGIFSAHPWLSGPKDSYLGFWTKGGGASSEHSHATNLWQYFAHLLEMGRVSEVSACMKMVETGIAIYDQSCFLNLVTEKGFPGRVVQDVITFPIKLHIRLQYSNGFLEVVFKGWEQGDIVRYGIMGKQPEEIRISKTRSDDFYEEIMHIDGIIEGRINVEESPISFKRGLDTVRVIQSAHVSRLEKKTILL